MHTSQNSSGTTTSRIDDTLRAAASAASELRTAAAGTATARAAGDIDPASLEGQLRQLVPSHAFWRVHAHRTGNDIADAIGEALTERLGPDVRVIGPVGEEPDDDAGEAFQVTWSTSTGMWLVGAHRHGGHLYHLAVNLVGDEEVTLRLRNLTAAEIIEKLVAVGAVTN